MFNKILVEARVSHFIASSVGVFSSEKVKVGAAETDAYFVRCIWRKCVMARRFRVSWCEMCCGSSKTEAFPPPCDVYSQRHLWKSGDICSNLDYTSLHIQAQVLYTSTWLLVFLCVGVVVVCCSLFGSMHLYNISLLLMEGKVICQRWVSTLRNTH